jgi:hypothetical protein
MQRLTMLASPDGRWLLPQTPEFFAALGDPSPDYDSEAFAVRNLGFVKLQFVQDSFLEIELHPRNVQLPALLAAQQQVLRSQVRLFRVKYLITEWQSEISSSAEHTVERLSELCAPAFTPPLTERFLVKPQDLSILFDGEHNPLRPLAQKWRVSFGEFDPSIVPLALKHNLLSRLMIAGIKPRQNDPVWRFIGNGHTWIGDRFQHFGIGEKVENMPDKEYGGWARQFYASVAATGQPRFDLVTAGVHYEDETGKPQRPVRYERLMLPWRTPSDEIFVTMCSRTVDRGPVSVSVDLNPESSVAKNLARSA